MNKKNWTTTKQFLMLARDIEGKIQDLERCEINVPQLDYTQSEIIMTAPVSFPL